MAIRIDPDDLHTTFGVLKALYRESVATELGAEDSENLRGVIGLVALRLYGDDARTQRIINALAARLHATNAASAEEVRRLAAEMFPPTPQPSA